MLKLAQGIGQAGPNLGKAANAAGVSSNGKLEDLIGTGISAALTLVGLVFLILMVYGGYLWMTARGQEEIIGKAKNIIIGTVIGLVVVVAAYAITVFVIGQF
jgi:hypothetical protein